MRTIGGILLGCLLFFPGVELVRWLVVQVLGVYDSMSLTDGCLFMVMVLFCVYLVRGRPRAAAETSRQATLEADPYEESHLRYLPSHDAPGSPRTPRTTRGRTPSGRRATRRSERERRTR